MYKNKIAILDSGFIGSYLNFLVELCEKNSIDVDFYTKDKNFKTINHLKKIYFENEKYIEELCKKKDYDFILGDCYAFENVVSIFHLPTKSQRMECCPNFIYKFFYYIGHRKKIKEIQIFLNKTPKIFVVSSILKEDLKKHARYDENKIKVVYPGFEFDDKKITNNKKREENSFVIGLSAVGFVTKGGFILLDAIRRLRKKYPYIKAKIIYPKYKTNLGLFLYMNFWNLKKNVEFLTYQKEMSNFYNSLDCFVCASICEAFGRVVTESMNFKVPTIVSSTTGAKDIIKDGENGLIFERKKYSGEDLAKKIEYIINNKEEMEKITEKAYITAQALTWKNFAYEIFNELYSQKF